MTTANGANERLDPQERPRPRRRRKMFKLRTQLLLMFIFTILVTLGVGSVFLYSSMLNMLQQRSEETTVASFRQVDDSLYAFRSRIDSISKSFLMGGDYERFFSGDVQPGVQEVELIAAMKAKMSELTYSYPYIVSIYLFADDGRVTGINATDYIYRKDAGDHPFYASEEKTLAAAEAPKLVWTGGKTVADYDRSFRFDSDPSFATPLITAARRIEASGGRGGTLVVNVDEAEVYATYRNLSVNPDSRVFMLDGKGRVISSSPGAEPLGKPSAIYARMTKTTGSFTEDGADGGDQVIYYRIPDSNWTLCMEIPIKAYTSDINRMRSTIVYIALISLAIAAVSAYFWTRRLTKPFYTLIKGMRTLEQGRLGVSVPEHPGSEIGLLITEFNTMSRSIQELMTQQKRIEGEKRKAELQVLQSHIQPHFLFNTLNTIKWMAIAANAKPIMESIAALGSLIRPIFKKTAILVPLQEELEHLRHYMTIMNSRYGEGAVLDVDVADELREALIPRLLLQPLIENSLVHGLESRQYKGTVTISGRLEQGEAVLRVSDNGNGIPAARLAELTEELRAAVTGIEEEGPDRERIGLLNVHRRIRLHYGERYGLALDSAEGEGTTVTLRLPVVTES